MALRPRHGLEAKALALRPRHGLEAKAWP